MRGLVEILATILAGVVILAVAAYFFLGETPPPGGETIVQVGPGAPDAGRPPSSTTTPSTSPPSTTPPEAGPSSANAPRVLVPAEPGATRPAAPSPTASVPGAAPALEAPEGYVIVEDQLAPARDVGGGVVSGSAPVRVGPIVRLQKAPEVKQVIPEPAPVEPRRFFRVVVADAGTLVAGERTLRLADVDVPAADAECGDAAGHRWSCGTRARTALRRFVRHRAVECLPLGEADLAPDGQSVVRCRVGRTDIATWLVENGWASPADAAAPALAALGETARSENRGLWQTEPVGLDEPDDDAADASMGGSAADGAGSDGAAPTGTDDDPAEAAPGQ
jgi:endonuclease YncB( thermonuclease family)